MRGKVAIVGIGVSNAGVRPDASQEDLLVEAGTKAISSSGMQPEDIQASWFGCTTVSANHALLNFSLKLGYTSMTKVSNAGATGADVLRNAYLAVASGIYDVVLAAGVEKPTDSGFTHINEGDPLSTGSSAVGTDAVVGSMRGGADSGLYLTRYQRDYQIDTESLRDALNRIVMRSRKAGEANPAAWLRSSVTLDDFAQAQLTVPPLTNLDACEALDAAAAIVVASPKAAQQLGRPYVILEGFGMSSGGSEGRLRQAYGYTGVPETELAAQRAYDMAGINEPGKLIDHAEIFDFTSASELLAYEDLGLAPRGKAVSMILDGSLAEEGILRVNSDGGLLSNGYQAGASGLRQVCESVVQLLGGAGQRQLPDVNWSLVQTLGGSVGSFSSTVQLLRADE